VNQEAVDTIRVFVRTGFYDADTIFGIVTEELYSDEEIDIDSARSLIHDELAKKRTEQKDWPKVTDVDRLASAFREMEEGGIIALHDAGFTQSEGMQEMNETYDDAGGVNSSFIGYCFYSFQDLEYVIKGKELMLTFGDIQGRDDEGVSVGHIAVAVLKRHGLKPSWSGLIDERISIYDMVWLNRGDG
jgi:hypothetical protein